MLSQYYLKFDVWLIRSLTKPQAMTIPCVRSEDTAQLAVQLLELFEYFHGK